MIKVTAFFDDPDNINYVIGVFLCGISMFCFHYWWTNWRLIEQQCWCCPHKSYIGVKFKNKWTCEECYKNQRTCGLPWPLKSTNFFCNINSTVTNLTDSQKMEMSIWSRKPRCVGWIVLLTDSRFSANRATPVTTDNLNLR